MSGSAEAGPAVLSPSKWEGDVSELHTSPLASSTISDISDFVARPAPTDDLNVSFVQEFLSVAEEPVGPAYEDLLARAGAMQALIRRHVKESCRTGRDATKSLFGLTLLGQCSGSVRTNVRPPPPLANTSSHASGSSHILTTN